MDLLLSVGCGAVVGIALGLTGGGGSIFAMPLLIYVIGLAPAAAIPVSLAAVALVALVGALQAAQERLPVWPAAAAFGLGGVVGAPAGIAIAQRLSDAVIVGGFAALAFPIGFLMWWRSLRHPKDASVVRARPVAADDGGACRLADDGRLRFSAPCALVLGAAGIATGVMSGVFGVGGGFVIVPVLGLVTQMGIHRAVATSLVALSAIGLAGAGGAMLHQPLAWAVLLPFVAGGASGMAAGRLVAARLAGPALQRVFATAVILVACIMGARAGGLL